MTSVMKLYHIGEDLIAINLKMCGYLGGKSLSMVVVTAVTDVKVLTANCKKKRPGYAG